MPYSMVTLKTPNKNIISPLSTKSCSEFRKVKPRPLHRADPRELNRQKSFTMTNVSVFLEAYGWYEKAVCRKPKSATVDAQTQTEDPMDLPMIKINNICRTPERKMITPPNQLSYITPNQLEQNLQIVLNKIKTEDLDHCQDYTVTQQKLLNVITPKSNFVMNSNNFKSNKTNFSTKSSPQFENINLSNYNLSTSPISTKSWRSNKGLAKGRKLPINENPKTTPKLQRIIKHTKELRTRYSRSSMKLLIEAYEWLKNIIKKNVMKDDIDTKEEPITVEEVLVEKPKQDNEMFQFIRQEIQELKTMIKELKGDFAIIPPAKIKKEHVEILITPPVPPVMSGPPPPPPPPLMSGPPPPPPPPMPLQIIHLSTSLPINPVKKTNLSGKVQAEENRPEISLADILKVKLRKPSERPDPSKLPKSKPPATSTPVVTLAELKQVRLKPVSKLSIPSNPEIASNSNSPVSSLKRLLTNGSGAESRPKRMRHSFKNRNDFDRERNGN